MPEAREQIEAKLEEARNMRKQMSEGYTMAFVAGMSDHRQKFAALVKQWDQVITDLEKELAQASV